MSKPSTQLPQCFDGGLKFGDTAQIKFIKAGHFEDEEMERMAEQGMKRYRVHVHVDGSYHQDVWATSEEDATAQVEKDYEISYVDEYVTFETEEVEC